MTQTAFLRLDTLVARASKTGTVLPSIFLTLCSTARLEFAFVNAEDVVGPLTGTVISVQCGVKTAPNAENVLLLTECADNAGEGAASRRIAEWSATTLDNDELREFLGGELSKTGTSDHGPWMEIVVDRDGVVDRFSFPITLKNAFIRPEDAAPNPRDDTSWTWLKSRIAVAGGLISKAVDDTLKKITLSVAVAWSDVTGKPSAFAPSAHSHATSDITGLDTALAGKAASALIGANSGIAPLDSGGKVPAANLPSYVDDVIEAADFAALPSTGETSKIYVTLDTGKTYRWSGSAYVVLNELPAFASEAEAEAGADNNTLMTPLRTAQAIAAQAGGGGVAVTTGTRITGYWSAAPSGFVLANGETIGNASSGATRANADTEALFLLLWAVWADDRGANNTDIGTQLFESNGNPISGESGPGSTGTAAGDWAANYRLAVPDERERVAVMTKAGGTLAGKIPVIGAAGGEKDHTLTETELPTVAGHKHALGGSAAVATGSDYTVREYSDEPSAGANSGTAGGFGSNTPHNNVQPFTAINVAIKL